MNNTLRFTLAALGSLALFSLSSCSCGCGKKDKPASNSIGTPTAVKATPAPTSGTPVL